MSSNNNNNYLRRNNNEGNDNIEEGITSPLPSSRTSSHISFHPPQLNAVVETVDQSSTAGAQTGAVEIMQGNISELDLHNTASDIDKSEQRLRNKAAYGGDNTKPPPKLSGLDIMKDDINDMPLTPDMLEAIPYAAEPQKQMCRVEIINDDGDDPAPFNSKNFEDDQDIIAKREARSGLVIMKDDINDMPLTPDMLEAIPYAAEPQKQMGRVEIINDDGDGPTPFNSKNFEDDQDIIAKREARSHAKNEKGNADDAITRKMVASTISNPKQPTIVSLSAAVEDEESIYVPTQEDIEGDNIRGDINKGDSMNNRRGLREFEASRALNDGGAVVMFGSNNDSDVININHEAQRSAADVEEKSINMGAIHVPEAWAVQDDDDVDSSIDDQTYFQSVYDAILALPWWRQRRLMVLLGLMFVSLAAMAIALGVSLGTGDSDSENTAVPPASYGNTAVPSAKPSLLPTVRFCCYVLFSKFCLSFTLLIFYLMFIFQL